MREVWIFLATFACCLALPALLVLTTVGSFSEVSTQNSGTILVLILAAVFLAILLQKSGTRRKESEV